MARVHQVSHQAAMNALRRLADLGIVTEQTRNGRDLVHRQPRRGALELVRADGPAVAWVEC